MIRGEDSVANKRSLIWFLVLQVIIFQGHSIERENVAFTLQIKNEMYGLERPSVFYWCHSSERSVRWHKSLPKSVFSWDFEVPPFGTGMVIHKCHILSSQGTVDLEIKTFSMTSTLCGGHVCKYVFRPNGVYFVGFEIYHPHNILLRFIELVRPVETLVEPWKAWSPHQLKALRAERNRGARSEDDVADDKDGHGKDLPKRDDDGGLQIKDKSDKEVKD